MNDNESNNEKNNTNDEYDEYDKLYNQFIGKTRKRRHETIEADNKQRNISKKAKIIDKTVHLFEDDLERYYLNIIPEELWNIIIPKLMKSSKEDYSRSLMGYQLPKDIYFKLEDTRYEFDTSWIKSTIRAGGLWLIRIFRLRLVSKVFNKLIIKHIKKFPKNITINRFHVKIFTNLTTLTLGRYIKKRNPYGCYDMDHTYIRGIDLSVLTNLKTINFSEYSHIPSKSITCLTNLTSIRINNNFVKEDLMKFPNLKKLDLSIILLGSISKFRKLTRLETLILNFSMILDASDWKCFTNLTKLDFGKNTPLTDPAGITVLTNLKTLYTRNCNKITNKEISVLTNLEKLQLNSSISAEGLAFLPKLTYIDLNGHHCKLYILMEHYDKLTGLDLSYTKKIKMSDIAMFTNLTFLNVKGSIMDTSEIYTLVENSSHYRALYKSIFPQLKKLIR